MVCQSPDPPENAPQELNAPLMLDLLMNGVGAHFIEDSDDEANEYVNYQPLPMGFGEMPDDALSDEDAGLITDPEEEAENPAPANPASGNLVSDNPASDNPALDNPASDNPASDNPASDNPASDHPAADNPASDIPSIEPMDRVLAREVWTAPRNLDSIQMDSERAAEVMSAMANFVLPSSSIPPWAQSVTEDQWKQTLNRWIDDGDDEDF